MSNLSKRLREWADLMATRGAAEMWPDKHADLLAAASAIEAGEWREIASAPKDGTAVELALRSTRKVRVCFWEIPAGLWALCGTTLIYYNEDEFTHWRPFHWPGVRG